jgi:hypothetical protein
MDSRTFSDEERQIFEKIKTTAEQMISNKDFYFEKKEQGNFAVFPHGYKGNKIGFIPAESITSPKKNIPTWDIWSYVSEHLCNKELWKSKT